MFCAIIGDIVESRKIYNSAMDSKINDPERHALQEKLNKILDHINKKYASDIITPFAIGYGDDFEGIVKPTCCFLEIAMRIIRTIYPVKIRFAFGFGNMRTIPDNRIVFQSDGPAMYYARDALNQMKNCKNNTGLINMIFTTNEENVFMNSSLLINALFDLLTIITNNWTENQLKIVWATEDYEGSKGKQMKAAKQLGITAPAISESLKKSNYAVYRKVWTALINYFELITINM